MRRKLSAEGDPAYGSLPMLEPQPDNSPGEDQRRLSNIRDAFNMNDLFMQTSPMADPAAVNPVLQGTPWSGGPQTETDKMSSLNWLDRAYLLGKIAAQRSVGAIVPPQSPVQNSPAGKSAAIPVKPDVKPPLPSPAVAPVGTAAKPMVSPVQAPPAAPTAVAQLHNTAETTTARAKQGDFQLVNGDSVDERGAIAPDNGERLLGTNFVDHMSSSDQAPVSKAFDAMRIQKNLDVVNSGNEASLSSPGV